jgi:plastocyanin
MTESVKSKQRKTYIMFASPIQHYRPKRAFRCDRSSSAFLKYLNTCTLAFALFAALALLTSIRGKEPETKGSSFPRHKKTEVVIDHLTFSPRTVTVPVGATVTWTNRDNVPHAVVSADNQFNKSPVLNTGRSSSNTFETAGVYSYFCSIHPRMTGKVIVN